MLTIGLYHYLLLGALLVLLGTAGMLIRRNAIVMFMSVELILNGCVLTFVAFNRFRASTLAVGHASTFFIIAVAAAEAAVGLAIILSIFRARRSVNVDDAAVLRH